MVDREAFGGLFKQAAEKETPVGLAKAFARDLPRMVPNVALGVVQDIGGLADAASESVFDTDLFTEEELKYKPFDYETVGAGVAGSLLGFAVPYTGLTKLAKVGKLGRGLAAVERGAEALAKSAGAGATLSKVAGASARYGTRTIPIGAVTDVLTTRQWEPNFSAMLEDAGVNNAVVRFLSADEETPWLEKRLKGALEGMVLGAGVDSVVQGLRIFKANVVRGGGLTDALDYTLLDDTTKRFLQASKVKVSPERQRVRDQLRPLIGDEVADATLALSDARALTWATKAGTFADEWYKRLEIRDGNLIDPDGFTAAPDAAAQTFKVFRGVQAGRSAEEPGVGQSRFFSPDRQVAEAYAGTDGTVVEETLTFRNPLVADNWMTAKAALNLPEATTMDELLTEARARGHDGAVFNSHNGKQEIVDLGAPKSDVLFQPGYANVPDPLMGFSGPGRQQRVFDEQNYPYELPLKIRLPDGTVFEDGIKGMNKEHALERARRNWPGSEVEAAGGLTKAVRGVTTLYQPAFHGSPHTFSKFCNKCIGTGEGAQSFGWGLYFTQAKQIAEYYRDTLTSRQSTKVPQSLLKALNDNDNLGFDSARQALNAINSHADWSSRWEATDELAKEVEAWKASKPQGRLYEVDIAPTDDEMLRWDLPLSQQPEKIRETARKLFAELTPGIRDEVRADETGREVYSRLAKMLGNDIEPIPGAGTVRGANDEAASKRLLELGIRGIKYPAQGGRSSEFNFVVFDDSDVAIKQMYQGGGVNPRGSVSFTDDGKALVAIFKNADASTAAHELAHIFRRDLAESEPELAGKLSAWLGKSLDAVTREDEEMFATSFERYLRDGQAPTPELRTVFRKFKTWLTTIYDSLVGTPLEKSLDDNIRTVFDRMLGGKGPRTARFNPIDPSTIASLTTRIRQDVAEAVQSGEQAEDALTDSMRLHINFDRLDVTQDVGQILRVVEEITQPIIDSKIGSVQTLEAVKEIADDFGEDSGKLMKRLADLQRSVPNVAASLVAGRQLRNAVAADIVNLAKKAPSADTDERILRRVELLARLDATIGVIQKEVARGTGSGRITVGVEDANLGPALDAIRKTLSGANGKVEATNLRKALEASQGDSGLLTSLIKRFDSLDSVVARSKFVKGLNEVWMASLLSGVRTQVANIIGNAGNSLLQPGERIIGGLASRDVEALKSGFNLYRGLAHYAFDFFRGGEMFESVKTAFLTERPVLDPGSLGKADVSMGAIPGVVGKGVRLPFRFLGSADEFFKQINYRAAIRDEAYRTAASSGVTDQRQVEEFVQSYILRSFDEFGSAANDPAGNTLRANALQYAREATFTQELLDGTLGKSLSDLTARHPLVRQIVPFIRTPTNIIRKVGRLTPVTAPLMKEWRGKLMSPDPMVRASAKGELLTGTMFWIAGISLAQSGRITGAGPSNRKEREALLDTGWRPYSVVTTNDDGLREYISYQRIDPFSSILGMAADFAEIAGNLNDDELNDVGTALVAAVARNLTNKTYMKSLADITNALSAPDKNVKRFLSDRVSSFVPNLLGTFNDDPYLRDVRSWMDGVKRKIPGLSESLPPRRNVLGEPVTPNSGFLPFGQSGTKVARAISPAAYSRRVGDDVKEELASLQFGFGPPPRAYQGVPLDAFRNADGQDAYDRWFELHGEVKVGGKTLHDALNRLVGSAAYQRIEPPAEPGDQYNRRVQLIQDTIGRYREVALKQMLREFPQVMEAHRSTIKERRSQHRSTLLQRLAN